MNNEINIDELFLKIPKIVQDCVLSDEWKKRFQEIVSKYSLNDNQASVLHLEILLIIVGVESFEDFSKNIKIEAGISDLLADQLSQDIEQRLFSWIDKQFNSENSKKENIPIVLQQTIIEKTISDSEKDIPEIRPQILPATEPGETAHDTLPTQEQIQRPLAVPRYTAVPMETKENEQPKNTSEVKPTPVEPVKRYAVDPYREPIE